MTSDTAHEVVIIGSGFGGMSAAIALRRQGIEDFAILERRDFCGGTWCQNTYPGAAVDVPSPLYSLSTDPYPWTRMFADGAELSRYTADVFERHGLRGKTVLGAEVVGVEWTGSGWEVRTAAAGTFRARFVINASGPLSTPVVPDFPGRESFRGPAFHTNAWDHSVDLAGKRVAVIGSGASAAQVIPAIQPKVGELHVFQRTPHWVMPRPDREFKPWQRRLLGNRLAYGALRASIYWQLESRVVGFKYSPFLLKRVAQRSAEAHLARQVADPGLRAKLTPDYTIGCKRIILSDTLYPALAASNVTLHDRDEGISRIDESGIITAAGEHVDLDAIVWSTGYDATDGLISYPVVGREGVRLADRWAEFPRAYLGTTLPGFPNFFLVTGPNTGIGHTSALFLIESQMAYITRAIDEVRRSGATSLEVDAAAEERYTTTIHREMERTVWKSGGCDSWYRSRSGHVVAMYPGFSFTFRRMAKSFRRGDHVIG